MCVLVLVYVLVYVNVLVHVRACACACGGLHHRWWHLCPHLREEAGWSWGLAARWTAFWLRHVTNIIRQKQQRGRMTETKIIDPPTTTANMVLTKPLSWF